MARRAAKYTQADIARALRAYRAEGVLVRVVLLPDGSTSVEPIQAPLVPAALEAPDHEINL